MHQDTNGFRHPYRPPWFPIDDVFWGMGILEGEMGISPVMSIPRGEIILLLPHDRNPLCALCG